MELDIYPKNAPEKAIEIDASLGDGSQFHSQYDYYAHGVGPETAVGPKGWRDRLIPVEIPPRVGSNRRPVAYCMEMHDLILAKCVAGRDRDWRYAREAVKTPHSPGWGRFGPCDSGFRGPVSWSRFWPRFGLRRRQLRRTRGAIARRR